MGFVQDEILKILGDLDLGYPARINYWHKIYLCATSIGVRIFFTRGFSGLRFPRKCNSSRVGAWDVTKCWYRLFTQTRTYIYLVCGCSIGFYTCNNNNNTSRDASRREDKLPAKALRLTSVCRGLFNLLPKCCIPKYRHRQKFLARRRIIVTVISKFKNLNLDIEKLFLQYQ